MTNKWRRDYGEGHIIDEATDDASFTDGTLASTTDGDQNCATGVVDPSHPDRSPPPLLSNEQAKAVNESSPSSWPVPLYIPNLLGYLRIILSFYGLKHALRQHHGKALNIWIVAALLDLIDGVAARTLNQCSQFGILLDIMADNILRSIVWISAMIESSKSDSSSDYEVCIWVAIISLEWITMFCSQSNQTNQREEDHDVHWKDVDKKSALAQSIKTPPPFWVRAVFKNNFRSLPGIFAIYGLFVAPFGTYVWYADRLSKATWPSQLLSEQIISILVQMSYAGRFLSAMVELWLCSEYLGSVIARDRRQKTKQKYT
mmetsp:Transcript_3510/g.7753  ORF Transcript_3510/g.7753 Transcript_3510/m.7753 type:complete len:316 (+) Transcript_3510:14-961(+)